MQDFKNYSHSLTRSGTMTVRNPFCLCLDVSRHSVHGLPAAAPSWNREASERRDRRPLASPTGRNSAIIKPFRWEMRVRLLRLCDPSIHRIESCT
jgi:hypothetical protein